MNVWIVNPFDNLPSEGNRAQRYWLMSEAFAWAGHRVTYWTSDFSHATKRKRVQLVKGNTAGIDVVLIPTLPYETNVCWARVKSHLKLARDFERMARGEVDVVIASTPPLGLCAAAWRVAKARGARFVCDIQDAWPETFVRLLPKGLKWAGAILFAPLYRMARRLYREADLVTGVCARYAKFSKRRDFHLAYLGIEGRGVTREKEDRTRNGVALVYIGNLGEGYDLETVIEAVAKRENLTLDIAGKGPQETRLRSRVQGLGLGARVRFHGFLGQIDLEKLLARCDVGVIPMRDDSWVGLPNKLADYLQAGLRVVSSLHGECGDLLAWTQFGGTYDWGSADALLAALDALPDVDVSLPNALRAECIYSNYVTRIMEVPSAQMPSR